MTGNLPVAFGVVLVGAGLTASCDRADPQPSGGGVAVERKAGMPQAATNYPNYVEVPDSPPQDGPGVAIRLAPPARGLTYRVGEPIILNGRYGADSALNDRADGSPPTRIVVRVGQEGQTEAPGRPAKDASNMPPPSQRPPSQGGTYVIYGCFNVDLQPLFKVLGTAGKYWVTAEFFELKSEKIEFEVK
jgi:hypothetical protein